MKWSEVSVHTTHEATEAVANILHEAGASGVVIEDSEEPGKERVDQYGEIYALDKEDFPSDGVIIKAYLPVTSFINETVENLELAIEGLRQFSLNPGRFTIGITEVDEEDWANSWKQYFHPVKISKRFTIVPTWEEYTPVESDELIIELDPGMAFGTGTHPTTVLCLQALEKYLEPGQTIVDVGTGSGVLAIGAALLGAKHITALDLDEVAVRAAQENVTYNHADDRITVLKGNLLDSIEEPPDMIIANILAEVIMSFSQDAYQLVKPGGLFITSGIIGAKRDEVRNDLMAQGFDIVETVLMEDWVAIIARKGSE
ncbi:50S ribosomal protein L11 methyltransferase [Sporosarcina sp. P12(2017)]|uniref:Ribosomal protein L11 methyltransferase n=1 Tax=Sporosarcina ureae TaxID=1571 RepID=A0ABM6JZ98_SPOUR|nr:MULTISPECIES: 50S ribosomal protein L11 methyltransferase [Sporosarcina]ARF15585.1 ribosomal protein L11 methyltransferase [Sporosarcina ureae]PIC59011.1 50S ribosomal protein L11 methyltransferase [Sporosarcina sp. P10]PIC62331.1 50S ribosomal protein L11 methyltransferase [Sporosarcina sp. P12(2017)]PIC78518.1 50S ribosomal protein L11 methyltransferase [Sporosarcina sp. P19]